MSSTSGTQTRWWHGEGDKIVCELCPRECHIAAGKRGFCFVRANEGGQMVLTTYGKSTGFCIDPIEKKPLNHFLPGTPVLSFGTAGCNLGCKFCQNWDISKSREIERLSDSASPEAIVEAARQMGCRSIAFTYNDPVIWAEYAIDTAKAARAAGIKTVAVTAGYISPGAPREEFYQWMDAANVDLKAFTELFYKYVTLSHLEPVLDTLKWLKHQTDVWFEITNLVIPGENDSEAEIQKMCHWIVDNLGDEVPVHFTAFHPDYKMMDKPRTPHETLIRAREQAQRIGIQYPYVGNVNDVDRQSTYCPKCSHLLIQRDWYDLGVYNLKGNCCGKCGQKIPGVFEAAPGNWGRKRLPVRIDSFERPVQVNLPGRYGPAGTPAANDENQEPDTAGAVPPGSCTPAKGCIAVMPIRPAAATALSSQEMQTLLGHARAILTQAVTEDADPPPPLEPAVAQRGAYGVYVTLRRGSVIRAQRWDWGEIAPLGPRLDQVVRDCSSSDSRFPRISGNELPLLELELAVMDQPVAITAPGLDRPEHIELGKHGVILIHPGGSAGILPYQAKEKGWDAHALLDEAARAAGLDEQAWEDDDAQLKTFTAQVERGAGVQSELDPAALPHSLWQSFLQICQEILAGREPSARRLDEQLTRAYDAPMGLYLFTRSGLSGMALGGGHSLLSLAKVCLQSLAKLLGERGLQADQEQIARGILLHQPLRLHPADHPARHGGPLLACAVLTRTSGKWSITMPDGASHNTVGQALQSSGLTLQQWAGDGQTSLTAYRVLSFVAQLATGSVASRKPARAGQFYPEDAKEMDRQVTALLSAAEETAPEPKRYRAIMLPHAGWRFCGATLAKTLIRAEVPQTVIVLSPKHTPFGEPFSIPPHQYWEMPCGKIPIATELGARLMQLAPQVSCESEAHRLEHGVEVLLPFLRKLSPNLHVLPLVVGHASYEQTLPLAQALATIIQESETPVLLVISSDMNHFAPEARNRALDELALEAMFSGRPMDLYRTCVEKKISMCGMLPAVTVMQALQMPILDLDFELVDYTTSAQVSGDSSSVVGYAGVLIS